MLVEQLPAHLSHRLSDPTVLQKYSGIVSGILGPHLAEH